MFYGKGGGNRHFLEFCRMLTGTVHGGLWLQEKEKEAQIEIQFRSDVRKHGCEQGAWALPFTQTYLQALIQSHPIPADLKHSSVTCSLAEFFLIQSLACSIN